MAYCTADEVRGVLARDTLDPAGTGAGLYEPDIVDYHIAAAQAEVDARLAGRYHTPFGDPAPALVRSLTVDVAAYLATLTYRQSVDLTADDPVRLRYTRALELLVALGEGSLDLPEQVASDGGGAGDGQATGARALAVRNPYTGRLFGLGDFDLGYSSRDRPIPGTAPNGW